jgi:hypothetical protein
VSQGWLHVFSGAVKKPVFAVKLGEYNAHVLWTLLRTLDAFKAGPVAEWRPFRLPAAPSLAMCLPSIAGV